MLAAATFAAVVLATLLALPHLIGFSEYLDWGDTSDRNWSSVDSSNGFEYLLTLVAPGIWGLGSIGPFWFGEFAWHEPHVYAGLSVLMLALLGIVSGLRHPDKRCRTAVTAFAVFCVLGVLIAYVGGPLTLPLRNLTGSVFGSMARAKILLSLGIALSAAFGVERLVSSRWVGSARSLGHNVQVASFFGLLLAIGFVPFGMIWFDKVQTEGVLREVLAVSVVPALSAAAVAVLVLARMRGWLSNGAVGWALVAIVGFEMLSFVMPVHTIVKREQRLTATPAHLAVSELLEPGERLSGEGWTFFPATTGLFDIDDARGHLMKSEGYNELFRAEVPEALTLGVGKALPTRPYIPYDADIASPVWDAMAVGVWAQFPHSQPPGSMIAGRPAVAGRDPAREELTASLSSPSGGLRAVVLEVVANSTAEVEVVVETAGYVTTERRYITATDPVVQSFAFLGEDLPPNTPVSVHVSSPSPQGQLLVGTDDSGAVAATMVAGDDDLRLARTGDVLLIERPNAAFVRLADAVRVEADPQTAASAVAARAVGERSAVVDAGLGLPSSPAQDADLDVVRVAIARDRIEAVVRSDREALVVISVSNYPGWSAAVDGESAAIVTADAAFIGVAVPEGEHLVTLTFRPRHLDTSLLLFAFGLVWAVGLLTLSGRFARLIFG